MRLSRILQVTLAVVVLLFAAGTFAVVHAGFASVQIQTQDGEDSLDISLPLPLALAHIGVSLLPEKELQELRSEIGPHAHLITAAVRELAAAEDGVLVEVRESRELVLIKKEADRLVVHVQSEGEEVRVSVPLRSAASLLERILGDGIESKTARL